jgi:hypothetical protein
VTEPSIRIAVHATPGARRNHVGGAHDNALRVSVTAPADQGRANDAIAKLLAEKLGLRPAQVQLISGQTHRRKVFEVLGAGADVQARIRQWMDSA